MSTVIDSTRVFRVDAEHSVLRLAILLAFIVSWVLAFFLLSALISSEGLNLLAILISFGISYVVSTLLERYLKGRWHSGRTVEVQADSVRMVNKGVLQEEIRGDQSVTMLLWRFEISKRARVPKGWSMLACALQHEDRYLAVYTFMSPSDMDNFDKAPLFAKLSGKKSQPEQRSPSLRDNASSSLRLAGEQRRLADAESHRWMNGAEMSKDDFKTYLTLLETRYPEWTPIS